MAIKSSAHSVCGRALCAAAAVLLSCGIVSAQGKHLRKVSDVFEPLPAGNVHLVGYFDNDIQNSVDNWVKGVMPYDKVVDFFVNGRAQFALGEMVGKALRTNGMMYRYTQDPEIAALTRKVVYSLIATARSNGSISCTPVEDQPGDKDGDLWERKYVLLGLSQYYMDIDQDPKVLDAMEKEAHSIMDQVGEPPKKSITSLGWSDNHIESSTLLEPFMRLYYFTGNRDYLDFAAYIVNSGGGSTGNMFDQVRSGMPLREVGAPYPKAYEMTSLWEGLAEYYRATGEQKWKDCLDKYFKKVCQEEITIIGNGGTDVWWPKLYGEGWGNTAVEQSNPDVHRMMETCVGVTWMKYCSQYLRLTGNPVAMDYIEKYIYNGLLGAMRTDGRGFSYVNLLNGEKVTNHGWGMEFDGLPVTCCNLNGPTGLAYIPYVAFMQAADGPVVNLYNKAVATARTAKGKSVTLSVVSEFPRNNDVTVAVTPQEKEWFVIRLRIPSWSENTYVEVNGKPVDGVSAGSYLSLRRQWKSGDEIRIVFDMKARVLQAKAGRNPEGKWFQAVQWGPIVLARDENIDKDYDKPVSIVASPSGEVSVTPLVPSKPGIRMEFLVPTTKGGIRMVDYSSVDGWSGKHVQTWLPMLR